MIETINQNGDTVQDMLITYSEDDRQNNEINKANAALVFSPKFIPIYPELLQELTLTEALLYGFIDFYMSNGQGRFYFTNEQLSSICKCSVDSVTRGIKKLIALEYIEVSRKIRKGGGQIRFVNRVRNLRICNSENFVVGTQKKPQTNKNKINNNNKKKDIKKKFGEFVTLTEEEKKKLEFELNEKELDSMIEKMNLYCGSKGKRYKSYYSAILSWWRKDNPKLSDADQQCKDWATIGISQFTKKWGNEAVKKHL